MSMNNILVVVDMQNDFITGSLGNENAQAIVPNVVEKIKGWDGYIFATQDTHFMNYLNTQEGNNLPVVHCLSGLSGWEIIPEIRQYDGMYQEIEKISFGTLELPNAISELCFSNYRAAQQCEMEITLIGVVTNICVISNAIIIKSAFPEAKIIVDASCCASNDMELHNKALDIMESLQIEVINR